MEDKYKGLDKDIIDKIHKISSPSLKLKLLDVNSITNILLYDKEDKYHNEYKIIRGNYENKSFNIYKQISNIVNGTIDPSFILSEEDYTKYKIKKDNDNTKIQNFREIENFWLNALKNCDYFDISENEEKILKFLKNVQIELHKNNIDLTITYFFDENEFIKNKYIKKNYYYDLSNEKLEKSEFDEVIWKKKFKNNNNDKNKKNFFDMFDKEKVSKELDENEANFLKNDFMPNILEYYLDISGHKIKHKDDKIDIFSLGKINIKTIK